MPKRLEFCDRVRNKLRDYIGEKKLSVSNFAQKYSRQYADMFGKQDAPSVSTARKLIEWKDPYRYSEDEMRVLEKLTGIDFYQMWLENEERILLRKKEEYCNANGMPLTAASIDSEVLLGQAVNRYSKNADRLNCVDIEDAIQRYTQVETMLPLIVMCDAAGLAEFLIRDCVEAPVSIPFDRLAEEGPDVPNNIIYTSISVSPMSADAGRVVNTAIRVIRDSAELGRNKHIIVVTETMESKAIALAAKQWADTAFTLEFHWSTMLMKGWMNIEKDNDALHPLFEEFVDQSFAGIELMKPVLRETDCSYRPSFDKLFGLNRVMINHLGESTEKLVESLIRENCYTYGIVEFLIRKQNPKVKDAEVKSIQKALEENILVEKPKLPEKTVARLEECLEKAVLWEPLFKEEIRSWIAQGGSPVMPDCNCSGEWMSFLEDQHDRQRSILTDGNPLHKALRYLMDNGFPELWFSDECDQTSLLTAINAFDEWKERIGKIIAQDKEHEAENRKPMLEVETLQFANILLCGSVPSLDYDGWMNMYDRWFHHDQVGFNFDLAIENHNLRRRSVRKKK